MSGESIYRWESRDEVYVERTVGVWDVVDELGRDDDDEGEWRKRTPREFADAIIRATDGLTDPAVEAQENHGAGVVAVYGYRPTTDSEKAEFDTAARRQWERARDAYEAGLAQWGES